MPCFNEGCLSPWHNLNPLVVVVPFKKFHALDCIVLCVERTFTCHHRILQILAVKFLILLLNIPTICKHHLGKISGGVRTMNRSTVSALPQQRHAPHMIHMRMAQNKHINIFGRVKIEGLIFHRRLFALALEEPAIKENAIRLPSRRRGYLNFMTCTCDLLCCSMGDNFHAKAEVDDSLIV